MTKNGNSAYITSAIKYIDANCGEIEITKGASSYYSYDDSDFADSQNVNDNVKKINDSIHDNYDKCLEKYNSYDLIKKNKDEIDNCVKTAVKKEYPSIEFNNLNLTFELTEKGKEQYEKCDKTSSTTTTTDDTTIGTTKENSSLGNGIFIIIGVVVVIVIAIIFALSKKKKQPESTVSNVQEQQPQVPVTSSVQPQTPVQPENNQSSDLQNMFTAQTQQENNNDNNNNNII